MKPRNLIIYGPPGTGKTRRLLRVVEAFVKSDTRRVLFCSHTRAAAQEALSRWPVALVERVDIQTLHSLCFRGLKLSKAQTVDDNKLEQFGREFGIDMSDEGLGREFMDVLTLARSRCIPVLDGYEKSWKPGTPSHFEAFVKSYDQWKGVYGYVDFTDMLLLGAKRLTGLNYGLLAIDEAQDLTPAHWDVIYRLMEIMPQAKAYVAGDDDQALYAFAGADPLAMRTFGERVNADSVVLSQSYRITQQVYDVARAIIARVSDRVPKDYAPRTGLDGKPAQGKYEVWPQMDYMNLSETRDTLVLYADRFVRAEVEPIIQERGQLYKALNGFPSPLDSRAGRAMRVVFNNTDDAILGDDDLRSTVRSGLSSRGINGWDHASEREILTRIRRLDLLMLGIRVQHIDYLRTVDFTKPQNIRISTMHGAKGLQGDDVHLVLSLSPTAVIQGAAEPDHLHRLLYTAVTRTRENLYLYDGENGYELPVEYR